MVPGRGVGSGFAVCEVTIREVSVSRNLEVILVCGSIFIFFFKLNLRFCNESKLIFFFSLLHYVNNTIGEEIIV
jgi:hypothetical protein